MRILFYSSYFYPYTSGITTYPFKILTHLAKKHKITVLTFNHKKNKEEKETLNGFKVIRMPYLFKIYKGFISPQSLTYFINELSRHDLVLINLPNIEGLFLTVLSRLKGKKVISIFHCFLGISPKLYLKIINFLTNLIVTLQLILSNQIIGYTDDYINSLPIAWLIRKKTKTILPPILKLPVSVKKLKEFQALKKKRIWIGYAGRISNEKGLEYLIAALTPAGWLNRLPAGVGVELVFAGPYGADVAGENSYFLKIKNLLDKNKIKYHFLGNLTNGNLGSFYKAIDVLVLPSTNRTEAFGMVQAEAMLLGAPVIASNLPGVRVPIDLTRMGIIIEPKNIKQLTSALKKILRQKNKYTNNSLIKKAGEIFDTNKVFKFYANLVDYNKPKSTSEVANGLS